MPTFCHSHWHLQLIEATPPGCEINYDYVRRWTTRPAQADTIFNARDIFQPGTTIIMPIHVRTVRQTTLPAHDMPVTVHTVQTVHTKQTPELRCYT